MKFEMRMQGLDGVLDMLRRLPPEMVSKRGGPVKAALRKGAQVLLRQAKTNLQASVANATDDGERHSTGLLLNNLVVTRGKAPTDGKGERYLVRVRRKTYNRAAERSAEGRKAKRAAAVTTLKTAQLLEYGSSQQPAEPWLRPAFQSKAGEAIQATQAELLRQLDRTVRRLMKGRR